ncbi:YcaC-related amidohydrolase [Campylobacter pinnipediorum subsp. pinnipediorum]|uniref:isochorismatase family protein n=1 Tax=Campylobacter pinnipediorum TaxID=1965231 RepID=UPI000995DDFB|nr:isochorismatase family protein [Campylobacter pinnipediorum]AQW85215.1 YcaC-related amidohydrolase [Campylobacter pinnipediorum subsp. pinnipediorum]
MKTAIMIDMQDSLLNVMHNSDKLIDETMLLLKGLEILDINLITTEQYPKGLGKTSEKFSEFLKTPAFEKIEFSCIKNEKIKQECMKFDEFIVFGIEAHICVLQTIKDLLSLGKKVILVDTCTSSRSKKDKKTAINHIRTLGVEISSVQSVLFEILGDSKHPKFKEISNLIK